LWHKTKRYSSIPALLVIVADLVLLVVPIYQGSSGGKTLLQENSVAFVLAIWTVILLAACGIMVPKWPVPVIGLTVMALFVVAGAFTIGLFYAPALVAGLLVVAAQREESSEARGSW